MERRSGFLESVRRERWAAALGVVALAVLSWAAATGTLSWAGGLALVLVIAAVGAGLGSVSFKLRIPETRARKLGVVLIVALGAILFVPPLVTEGGFVGRGDWGVHHALVAALARALARGEIPTWLHGVSTGDAAFELYPSATYFLAAGLVRLFNAPGEVMTILFAIGALAHVLIAVGAARLAYRVASWPVGWAVGVIALLDSGGYSGGGAHAILNVALLHNAVSQALFLLALPPLLDALERPTAPRVVAIWLFVALACATHPTGLIQVAVVVVALMAAALVAKDTRPVRLLLVALHVALGAALAAVVWAPIGAKLLHYGVHYSNAPYPPWELLRRILDAQDPEHTFAALLGLSLVGVGLALASRRAAPTVVAVAALVLMFLATTTPYLFFDLTPSMSTARLGAHRLPSLLKPLLHGLAAFGLARMLAGRLPARPGSRVLAGALLAVLAFFGLRAAMPYLDLRAGELEREMRWRGPSPEAFDAMAAWARARNRENRPDRFGRLLYDGRENFSYHVGALSGLPILFTSDVPILFLRERIEDSAPESLRRFDVRWVFRWKEPPQLGDPRTEQQVGEFFVREVAGWDGQFARIESGEGEVRTLRLDDQRVEVEVTGTARPALVSFGMGYWPRWRARSGEQSIPLYATWATERQHHRVLAGWLPPGKTVLTPDGPLPEDGDGRPLSWGALGIIVVGLALGRIRRMRGRGLRLVARLSRFARRRRLILLAAGGLVVALGLAVRVAAGDGPARALVLGQGTAGRAHIEARIEGSGEPFERCDYSALRGLYVCGDLGWVYTSMDELIEDIPPSWRFPAPAIVARSFQEESRIEIKVTMRRELAGRYSAAAAGKGEAYLEIDPGPRFSMGATRSIDLTEGTHAIRLTFRVPPLGEMFTAVVAADALDTDRRSDVPMVPARPAD